MKTVLAVIVAVIVLLHGYFYIRYGTAQPCQAASVRAMADVGVETAAKFLQPNPGLAQIGQCYVVALMGTKSQAQRDQENEDRILKKLLRPQGEN